MNYFAQHITKILIALVFLLSACAEQEIRPTDIFEEEELTTETARAFELDGLGTVYINEDRVQETLDGIDIKGTVFTDSENGLIPISSGDFTLSGLENGVYRTFEGYGLNKIPKTGIFQDFEDLISPGAYYSYQSGLQIKQTFPDAPVQDDIFYFNLQLESVFASSPQLQVKNTSFGFNQLFFDPRDPSIYFEGNMEVNGKAAIENLGMGLSANGLLEFTPYAYSDELTEIMIRPMEPVSGNFYIKGEIPLEQYQIKIVGDAIVGVVLNSNGTTNFFENGLAGGEFRMGVNGAVFLNNSALDYVPADVEIELGRSTVIVNLEQEGEYYFQVAGQMESGDLIRGVFENIGAEAIADYLVFTNSLFEVYAFIGNDPTETQFYLSNTISMDFPGIGNQELAKAILEITHQYVYAAGQMKIPGVGAVGLSGNFEFDGDFELKGEVYVELDAEVAKFQLDLEVIATNSGVAIEVVSAVCVLEDECVHVGVSLDVDWENDSFTVCGDVPAIGEVCATL